MGTYLIAKKPCMNLLVSILLRRRVRIVMIKIIISIILGIMLCLSLSNLAYLYGKKKGMEKDNE